MILKESQPVCHYRRTGAIRYRMWADEEFAVVYSEMSGDTHLLDSFSLEVLNCLGMEPKTARKLEGELSSLIALEDQERLPSFVESSLLQLQSVDLVTATSL